MIATRARFYFAITTVTFLAAGCERPAAETPVRADVAASPSATRVVAERPTRATVRRLAEAPGQIEASESTPIYARISGYVRDVHVDIGSEVKRGQVLAEIEVPEVDAELHQKQAMIAQATADRTQAEAAIEVAKAKVVSADAKVAEARAGTRRAAADLEYSRSEFARTEQLVREKAQPPSVLDESRSRLHASEAGRDEVQAKVHSAEAALAESKAFLDKGRADLATAASRVEVARFDALRVQALRDYARIVAPFDGVVVRRYVDPGHLTQPGPAGEPLLVVERSGLVTVVVDVPERAAARVNPGDSAAIRVQALDGRTFVGKVTRVARSLDARTRTVRAEIDLENADNALLPGLYAYATITVEEHPDVWTIPTAGVVKDGDKTYCVAVVDGRAARKPIRVGVAEGTRTEVVSGLDGTEVVVAANAASLADGQPVEVVAPEGAAPKAAKP